MSRILCCRCHDCYLLVCQVYYEVTRRMLRLYHGNSMNQQLIDDFEFIDSLVTNPKVQLHIAARVVHLGIIEFCQYVCRKKLFRKKLFDAVDDGLAVATTAALTCLGCVANLTDISKDACHRVVEIGLHEDLFRFLSLDSIDPSKVNFCYIRSGFADSAMSVVYNVIQASWLLCRSFSVFLLCEETV